MPVRAWASATSVPAWVSARCAMATMTTLVVTFAITQGVALTVRDLANVLFVREKVIIE